MENHTASYSVCKLITWEHERFSTKAKENDEFGDTMKKKIHSNEFQKWIIKISYLRWKKIRPLLDLICHILTRAKTHFKSFSHFVMRCAQKKNSMNQIISYWISRILSVGAWKDRNPILLNLCHCYQFLYHKAK